jgi:hypothetical protein
MMKNEDDESSEANQEPGPLMGSKGTSQVQLAIFVCQIWIGEPTAVCRRSGQGIECQW